jgi:ribosome biogenesis GTPase
LEGLIHLYEAIGYPCSKVCALTGEGIEELSNILANKVTLFSGHSGVGKSTLINSILPGMNLKTGVISEYHKKGMHTTTFSEMIPIPGGGYMIDTPGIKGFGTIEMEGVEVSHYFPEIFRFSAACKFHNCSHRHEPDCAVLEALEKCFISESRYKSYLNILEDKESGKYREAY